ncbi:hydroxyacid dehydrogenase [Streptomyces sp. NBC_01411]|uniref:hydroxyacid dehydrogenase n=1 Tax=Streptomyces sp. NBC_01411 TaxID=2903857 RepID=UPI00324FA279
MTSDNRPRLALAMQEGLAGRLFDDEQLRRLGRAADLDPAPVLHEFSSPRAKASLARVDILVTGWGCPPLTAEVLARAPRLRAVVHAAGSVKHHVTAACWERGIAVSSAAAANAVPVAEYTVAMIVLANKRVLPLLARQASGHAQTDPPGSSVPVGNYRKQIGVVGASAVGRRVLALLRNYDVERVVADPYLTEAEAGTLGARLLGLDELVSTSDVVSLHAPSLPQTRHLMDARRLSSMRPGATLINTARGDLVDTAALTAAVGSGQLYAVLDVTDPEPLPADSPLWNHPHVALTPHVAGSLGTELLRMGELAVGEVERLADSRPLNHPVSARLLERMA